MTSNVVVDLSHYNTVDFSQVKQAGIVGVIHKATQGTSYTDPSYTERRIAAAAEGLLWGAYHFGTNEDGATQAEHFVNTVQFHSNVLMVLDVENNPSGTTMSVDTAVKFVTKFGDLTGYFPVLYGSPSFLQSFGQISYCPLWIAHYGAEPVLPFWASTWSLWQYTDGKTGPEPHSVPGIGPCDRDKFNGTVEELRYFWGSLTKRK